MILGEPWGLLALAAVPAVVALHLWRARHAPRRISGLFLFPADGRVLASGRRRAPLVLRPSFWCEILCILAVTWWLADLHWSPRSAARHLLIVLDDRWRMQAVSDGSSAADRLRQALDARLALLADGDRVTLIASGLPPRLFAGPAVEPRQARTALGTWQPQGGWHSLDAAITLAAGLGGTGAEILVTSDRQPPRLPDGVGVLATGRPATTSGLADVRWWRDASGERIVASVFGDSARVPVVRVGGLVVTGACIRPGFHRFDQLPPMAEDAVAELALPGPDALVIDDRVELVRPAARIVRAQVDAAMPGANAVQTALRAAGARLDELPADLAVGVARTSGAGTWTLRLSPGDGTPTLGPFTPRRDHPLLADVDPTGVLWTGSAGADVDGPLLIARDRTLISATARGLDQDIILHVDLTRSTVTRHPVWPGVFANLVAWRTTRLAGLAEPNPRCGQPLNAMLPAGVRVAELVAPDGVRCQLRPGQDGFLAIAGLQQPGRWSLHWNQVSLPISVLPLDARQADLADATSLETSPVAAGRAEVERTRSPLAALLPLVLAAIAACLAWTAFNREERV